MLIWQSKHSKPQKFMLDCLRTIHHLPHGVHLPKGNGSIWLMNSTAVILWDFGSLRTPIVVVFCCFPCVHHTLAWAWGVHGDLQPARLGRRSSLDPSICWWLREASNQIRSGHETPFPTTLRVPVRCVDILSYLFMTCLLYLSVTRLEKLRPENPIDPNSARSERFAVDINYIIP